jgi:hypothetical protein
MKRAGLDLGSALYYSTVLSRPCTCLWPVGDRKHNRERLLADGLPCAVSASTGALTSTRAGRRWQKAKLSACAMCAGLGA